MEKRIFTNKEIMEIVDKDKGLRLYDRSIKGDLFLRKRFLNHIELRGITLDGTLDLSGTEISNSIVIDEFTINGFLILTTVTIGGLLSLNHGTIKGNLVLTDSSMDSLELVSLVIENNLLLDEGQIDKDIKMYETTIEGCLDFSFKKGPHKIYLTPEMVQRVHYATPSTPLVIVKRKK